MAKITVSDYRGAQGGTIEPAPLALIVGKNGAGKSSLIEAAAAALTGEAIPYAVPANNKEGFSRLLRKGDAGQLVRDGAKKAFAEVATGAGKSTVSWPDCKSSLTMDKAPASLIGAGILAPDDYNSDALAALLGDLLRPQVGKDDFTRRMSTAGVSATIAVELWGELESGGWDKALATAKENASKARGRWENITGERYGRNKADDWLPANLPEGVDVTADSATSLEAEASNYDAEASRYKQDGEEVAGQLSALQGKVSEERAREQYNRALHERQQAEVQDNAGGGVSAEAALAEWEAAQDLLEWAKTNLAMPFTTQPDPDREEELPGKIKGAKSAATRAEKRLNELGEALPGEGMHYAACAECGAVMLAYEDEHGALRTEHVDNPPTIERYREAVAEYNNALFDLREKQDTVSALEDELRRLQQAREDQAANARRATEAEMNAARRREETARAAYQEAARQDGSNDQAIADLDARLAECESLVAEGQDNDQERARLQHKLDGLRDKHENAVAEADRLRQTASTIRTALDADSAHDDVQEWSQAADLCAPDGIRQAALSEVVGEWQEGVMAQVAYAAGWPRLTVTEDFGVRYGGRSWPLLSESEQWRARALLQMGIAERQGSEALVLDGADVVSGSAERGAVLQAAQRWHEATGGFAIIGMSIGTPANAPDLGTMGAGNTYWVQDGTPYPISEVRDNG